MNRLFRPTLVRRVFLSLLMAFSFVWIVLIAYEYGRVSDSDEAGKSLRIWRAHLVDALSKIDNEGEARAYVRATESEINQNYRMNSRPWTIVQLLDRRGNLLFSNVPPRDRGPLGMVDENQLTTSVMYGKTFLVFRGDTARWSIRVAEPKPDFSSVLRAGWRILTVYMLIAFPFILVSVWIAISRGLRPLYRLSDLIASRGTNNLSALGIDPKYAELKPLVSALDGLMMQLRNKIEREQAFVQDAAHELRTPMAVISAQAHVLCKASGSEERREAGQRLDHAIARAARLIRQLLQSAQVDDDRPRQTCILDVAQLVRQELAQATPAAIARKLDLSLEAPDVLLHALDMHAFQSILHNLLDNAFLYVPEGGRVDVELKAEVGALVLSVADDGPGIAEDQRALVFERFYRGVGHNAAGSGLGLAIVKQATSRLGGTIQLLSGLDDRGCQFVVTLPR